MKYLAIFLSFFLTTNLFAQIENFKLYQSAINKAELNLVAGKKQEALIQYYSILTAGEGNFSKDIYNALLVADELQSTDTFFVLLNMLVPKGLSKEALNSINAFVKYHHDKRWDFFLRENQRYILLDNDLRQKMDSLHIKDQYFRIMEGSYNKYQDTITKIDSSNMHFLFSLIQQNRFPGENRIGVQSISGSQGYDIVFHHYTQQTSLNKKLPKITPLLVNLVLQGKILPNKCAEWLELQDGEFSAGVFDVCGFSVNGKQSPYYIPTYSEKRKMIIEEYRKWLCMESLDEYYQKFLFVIQHPEAPYIFDIHKNIFDTDEKMMGSFIKNMKELK
jgi:hypothetical protein